MRSGSIYFVVRDFEKSLDFYEKLLDMKVSATNGNRFSVLMRNRFTGGSVAEDERFD